MELRVFIESFSKYRLPGLLRSCKIEDVLSGERMKTGLWITCEQSVETYRTRKESSVARIPLTYTPVLPAAAPRADFRHAYFKSSSLPGCYKIFGVFLPVRECRWTAGVGGFREDRIHFA